MNEYDLLLIVGLVGHVIHGEDASLAHELKLSCG